MSAIVENSGSTLRNSKHGLKMSVITMGFFVFAVLFRVGTLIVSIGHEGRLKEDGAIEYGAVNTRALALTHVLFYISAALESSTRRNSFDLIAWSGFVLYGFSVASLLGVMYLLGRFWTIKILISPNHLLVDRGLFKMMKHPNYFLNVLPELIGLALGLHAYFTLAFGLPLFLIPLSIRIREEERVMRLNFEDYS